MREKDNSTDKPESDDAWFDASDPRGRQLNKLQNIGTICLLTSMLCVFVGYFGPSEWQTDLGILAFVLLVLWIAASLHSNMLAKRWGIKTAEEKKAKK